LSMSYTTARVIPNALAASDMFPPFVLRYVIGPKNWTTC